MKRINLTFLKYRLRGTYFLILYDTKNTMEKLLSKDENGPTGGE